MSLGALVPRRISAQIALLIAVAIVSIHVILTAFFLLRSGEHGPPRHPSDVEMVANALDATPPLDRERVLAVIAQRYPDLQLRLDRTGAGWPAAGRAPARGRNLPPGAEERREFADGVEQIAIRLQGGDVVQARLSMPRGRGMSPLIIAALSLAVITIILGVWAARAVTAPLRAFARAAETFSPNREIDPLPERGPEEVRIAARALNLMRERIKGLIEDRTRMMAAVSHDLRTPITRLRLASEFLDDAQLRQQILRDLDQMNAMIESVLVFLREGRSARQAIRLDVASALQTVCDEFADAGQDVRLIADERVTITAEPEELRRAVANILENAVRYAGAAVVRLSREGDDVVVTIEDEGPGIPDGAKAAMLEPFVRGEAARPMDGQTGFGLGLSIASAIVEGHGGKLTLHDRQPRGLLVRLAFAREDVETARAETPKAA